MERGLPVAVAEETGTSYYYSTSMPKRSSCFVEVLRCIRSTYCHIFVSIEMRNSEQYICNLNFRSAVVKQNCPRWRRFQVNFTTTGRLGGGLLLMIWSVYYPSFSTSARLPEHAVGGWKIQYPLSVRLKGTMSIGRLNLMPRPGIEPTVRIDICIKAFYAFIALPTCTLIHEPPVKKAFYDFDSGGFHELVNRWVIGRRYTKHVSICFLEFVSSTLKQGEKGYPFMLGRTEDLFS